MTDSKNFENSYFSQVVQSVCHDLNLGMQKLITASLTVLTHLASLDSDMNKEDMSYLKYYLKKEFNLDQNVYRELVKDFYFIQKTEKVDSNQLIACKNYLKQNFTERQKRFFVDTLLCLSGTDHDMTKIEKRFVRNIGIALDIEESEVKASILTKSLSLMQSIDQEIASSNDLISDISELNEIEFASVHEFMRSLK